MESCFDLDAAVHNAQMRVRRAVNVSVIEAHMALVTHAERLRCAADHRHFNLRRQYGLPLFHPSYVHHHPA